MNEKEVESEEELSPMKPYASDLSDAEWAILQPLIPPAKPGGRPRSVNMRQILKVGIEALTTYDAYGDAEHERHKHRRDFEGHPINAVVVRLWKNRQPSAGGTVYLTNGPVADPFVVFDDYDWRSVIENGIFKEGKHPWLLGRFPQKTEAAVVVHCHCTLAVIGLCSAFRLSKTLQASANTSASRPRLSTALLHGEGTARGLRRLKEENRDKVIVFVEEVYGIFHLVELAILSGIRLSTVPAHLGSPQDILARYGLSP